MSDPQPAGAAVDPLPAGDPLLRREVWLAFAGPFARLPSVGDQVYYFPRGHADQCGGVQFLPHPPTDDAKPYTVSSVELGYDADARDPYAVISLQPDQGPAQPAAAPEHERTDMTYTVKRLDGTWDRPPFVVPKRCAESLFPPLVGVRARQDLHMVDVRGYTYVINHILSQGGSHTLSAQWKDFSENHKLKMGEGDAVVLMRDADGTLIAGMRRGRPSAGLAPQLVEHVRASVEIAEAAGHQSLTVTYYPRQGWPFVVPRKEVDDAEALGVNWREGMAVRMAIRVDTHELPSSRARAKPSGYFHGFISTVNNTRWCSLQVDWTGESSPNANVNVWQVEEVKKRKASDAQSSSKSLRISDAPPSSAT